MKQIVDKLNKIAKKIDESVEIPQTDLIIDSLDAITKAYGGTPNDSNLIVDKLEDIYNNIGSAVSGNIEITENGENINVAPYATATVNVSGGGNDFVYIINENVAFDVDHAGTVSNVDTSKISANDYVLCCVSSLDDNAFYVGIYTYAAEDDQSFDVKDYDEHEVHVYTEDGITWEVYADNIASTTVKLVIIKMPDFYSA